MEPLHIGYYREYPLPGGGGGCNRLLKRAKMKYDGDVKGVIEKESKGLLMDNTNLGSS